jgi:capsular polysaccharide biosynthesis protein
MEFYSGFVDPRVIELLRTTYLTPEVPPLEHANRKLYISRTKTAGRRLANEAELERSLSKNDFSIVYAEDLSFDNQISLFRQADVIAAAHGAGLANLVWCNPGCRVLEIFPASYLNDCYARLSRSLDLQYSFVRCVSCKEAHGEIPIAEVLRWL